MTTTRYAVCGLSSRGVGMFVRPLLGEMSGHGSVVAIVDVDTERVATFNQRSASSIPCYLPDDFDRMVDEAAPDAVIVTSPDYTHADYIVAALRRDIDVITEKPIVSSTGQARDVLAAERASKARIRVAHNLRYVPKHRQIKRMVLDGAIGRVVSVELTWSVDTYHGASYFYRWNRRRALSGGLSVHKSCHHFDLVNWWLDDVPSQVFSYGGLNYYGPDSPHRTDQLADSPYYQRWRDAAPVAPRQFGNNRDTFGLPYSVQYTPGKEVSLHDEEIDIEDTYSAVVRYRGGASLTYSVTFSGPWEGYRLAINGTHGRIETSTAAVRGDGPLPGSDIITYYPLFDRPQVLHTEKATGGHDGADPSLRRDLLAGVSEESVRLGLTASALQGAHAVAVGEAVWRSVRDNRAYDIDELLPMEGAS